MHLLHCKGRTLRYSPGQGNPHHWVVALSVGEGSEREQCHSLGSLPAFSHFCHYPQANWALLVLIPGWVGLCTFQNPVGPSKELSCEARSFSHCLNLHRCFQSKVLRLYFPSLEPWVVWPVSLPTCSSWFTHMQMLNHPLCQHPPRPVHQPLPCRESSTLRCLPPSLLLVWMNISLTPWLLGFHTV